MAMDIADTSDYDNVKSAVLLKYEISSETYRQQFRTNSIQDGETPRELQGRLKDLYDKWMTPGERTKEDIGDVIVLEQFLKILNPEIRTWIKEHNPSSSRQAAELAETFISARRFPYQLGYSQSRPTTSSGMSGVTYGRGITAKELNTTYVPQTPISVPCMWAAGTYQGRLPSPEGQ